MFDNKSATNLQAGQEFLAENGKREGVVTLPSGLQYEIIEEGTGPKPSATQTVRCHYHGTTIAGKVFDSSVQRGQPASFSAQSRYRWLDGRSAIDARR